MEGLDSGILSTGLMAMERAGDGIFDALMPSVMELFYWIKLTAWAIVIGVLLLTQKFIHPALAKAIVIFVVIGWLIQIFPVVSDQIITAMGNVGAIVVPEMEFDLSDPGYIAYMGFKATKPLMIAARKYLGPVNIFLYFFDFFFTCFAIMTVILAFCALALHAFFARVEYLILRTAAWFVIPFAALGKTSFIASKAIGYIAAVGLRVLALSVLAAVSAVTLMKYEEYQVMDITAAFGLSILSSALLVANVKAPAAAAALINSGPVLDGTSAWNAMRAGVSSGLKSMGSSIGNATGAAKASYAAGGGASGAVLGAAKALWDGGTSNFGGGQQGGGQQGGGAANSQGGAGVAKTGGAWDGPPSSKQSYVAAKLGVDISGMTKGQASLALEKAGEGASWYGGASYQGGWSQGQQNGNQQRASGNP